MTIKDVYIKYFVPPNLQEHMVTVAKVCNLIVNNWVGERVVKQQLIRSALLHDLGNIVKFDFDKHPEFLGPEQKRIDFWKQKQLEIIKIYGKDDYTVTSKMLSELGFDENSIESVSARSFANALNAIQVKESSDWHSKIVLYSDMRVLPMKVGSLEERLVNIRDRYPTRPGLEDMFEACRDIERQIQKHVSVSLSKITQELIDIDDFNYLGVSL